MKPAAHLSLQRLVFVLLIALLLTAGLPGAAVAQATGPGEPPPAPPRNFQEAESNPRFELWLVEHSLFLPLTYYNTGALQVNLQSRSDSLSFYQKYYPVTTSIPIEWTGSFNPCNPGNTSANFKAAVLRRINFFRAMAGVPATVVFSDESNRKAQAAALMMSANGDLDHTPPSSWLCYSQDGADGAGSSNLALGMFGWNAITGYMQDPGSGNSFAGHRRWILYPQTRQMGTGDIPNLSGHYAANSLVVFDDNIWGPRPPTREEYVAWPPPGYVPYPVVFARWSFSYANADFSTAAVSMTENGSNISVAQAAVANGYGENTLVWIPKGMNDAAAWPKPAADTTYRVTVSNVKIEGIPRSFTYDVIVFDPGS